MNIQIDAASVAQLRTFATLTQGLEIHHKAGKSKIIAKLREAGFTGDEINVEEEPEVKPTQIGEVSDDADFVEVLIHMEKGELDYVPVLHNGSGIKIPRGERVRINRKFYGILQDAQTKQFVDANLEDGLGDATFTPRFAMTVYV